MDDGREWVRFAEETARGAGQILRRHYGRAHEIHYKGDINLVTRVDQESEAFIMERIRAAFPGHGILSEESPEVVSPSEYRWVVDPLDGTTNYAHNYPCFCVSIALERAGSLLAGVVFDPLRDEMYTAVAGGGAFRNGERIRVSGIDDLGRALLATGFSYNVRSGADDNFDYFRAFVFAAQAIRRDGAAALDLCYLACGRFDGFWELALHPWDTAAGTLMVLEAGGAATRLDGGAYNFTHPHIVASNGLIHAQMLAVIREARAR